MAVTVITPATSLNMTTLSAVKDALGISDNDSEYDAVLIRLIAAASSALVEYSGKNFARQTYSETTTGNDGPILTLSNVPIVSVTSVIVDSEPVVDFVIQDKNTGVLYREAGWQMYAWVGWSIEPYVIPGTEELNITIQYVAGYIMPGTINYDLPQSYEEACIRTVVAWYKQDQRGGIDVKRRRVGELEIEYFDQGRMAYALPPDARSLIGKSAV
jgi:hypothetical protein